MSYPQVRGCKPLNYQVEVNFVQQAPTASSLQDNRDRGPNVKLRPGRDAN